MSLYYVIPSASVFSISSRINTLSCTRVASSVSIISQVIPQLLAIDCAKAMPHVCIPSAHMLSNHLHHYWKYVMPRMRTQ